MSTVDTGAQLFPELVDSPKLGYFLQNDSVQNEKHLSTINETLPYIEKHVVFFETTDVAPLDPVVLTFETRFGLPELMFFRIRQRVASYNMGIDPKHYNGKIDSLTLRIYGYDNRLLRTVTHQQFRELTRQNSNTLADIPQYAVLLSQQDLGSSGKPNERLRIKFEFELKAFSQPYELVSVGKELIISNIYYNSRALQGTIDGISIKHYYKQ